MFGLNAGVNAYAKVGVETGVVAASPARLIVMLYEGAIAACNLAIKHIRERDYAGKSADLTKAISIIENGLRASLDSKGGGEIAESLDALYVYMSKRLYLANSQSDIAAVEEVVRLLNELNEAWSALASQSAGAVPRQEPQQHSQRQLEKAYS
ncbi:flagellar export chaperone FliS [Methylobacillus flagellatus]|uniref:Flagellar secretion chaperone FliS n=1 Tax=Methylobacillus flagellatus (strain ATCC 51484 / DSM 6875 / VKM B-1610 / KT) TaxID=265072 RepID=Q1GZT7_METFK|nr:flagellar export chaperone FliS [Methylobacillus flagellatus]ABE50250.1 flagellar protein FliS [Methylobacillus flagellatus KT]